MASGLTVVSGCYRTDTVSSVESSQQPLHDVILESTVDVAHDSAKTWGSAKY